MARKRSGDGRDDKHQNDDTRTRLLEATVRIILERGIAAVRIDDVCAEVGVTKGSLYWHFENRQDLVRQALTEQLEQLVGESTATYREGIETAPSDKDEYLASLVPALANPFDPEEVERRWQRIELMAASRRDPEFAALMGEVQAGLLRTQIDIIGRAADKGLLREGIEPRALAMVLQALTMGSNLISLVGDEAPTPESWYGLLMFIIEQLYPAGG